MKTFTYVVISLCPLIALAWFAYSLNFRIGSGWEYVSRPKQVEFQFFKLGIGFLLIAPAVGLAMRHSESMVPLAGIFPGMMLMKEAVACWMITFTSWSTPGSSRVTPGEQLILCVTLTLMAIMCAYGPVIMRMMIRRSHAVRV